MILHITNDYSGSTVYRNLMGELDLLGIPQLIYHPVKDQRLMERNRISLEVPRSEIMYAPILNKTTDRLFYRRKIHKIFKDIESKVAISEIEMMHAHTWYSDGGVAYLLHKKYNIPYIVTIRNSDLNVFQKFLVHERSFGRRILQHAEKVILIASSYEQRVLKLPSLSSIRNVLASKLEVIPNGVDAFWIENAFDRKERVAPETFNFLFIGKFTEGKNVVPLQQAVKELSAEGVKVHLNLIGGDGGAQPKVMEMVGSNRDIMTYHGKVYDFEKLREHFEYNHIFAMPSKHETFGLVYIEALLQGLPVLYTANEGIDGFYDERIGEKVVVFDVKEIKSKLVRMMKEYASYRIPTDKLTENHNWKKIALKYKKLYRQS